MPVLAGIQAVLDVMAAAEAPADGLTVGEARRVADDGMSMLFAFGGADHDPVGEEHDHAVEVDGGTITVRVYSPPDRRPAPCHLYIHGGGFWMGTLDHTDGICRAIVSDVDCVVASVDYRLAPEHPFPTGLEDCYRALLWLTENAPGLGIDPERISIGGGSAGGNLATVVALLARDRNGPKLVAQVLEVPSVDLTMSHPSVDECGEGLLLTRDAIAQFVSYYLPEGTDATNPHASPLLADDLTGLPPALVLTAEFDPLHDEGEAYARRLVEAGIVVTQRRFLGHIHGSFHLTALAPDDAVEIRALAAQVLRAAHGE
jgi:acetyl esterase